MSIWGKSGHSETRSPGDWVQFRALQIFRRRNVAAFFAAERSAEHRGRVMPKPAAEAVSALINLAYDQMQAYAIATAMREADEGAKTARLIRLGLKELAQ